MAQMRPHREGYEDEEDCCGYYDPDKADDRRCHRGCSESDLMISDGLIKTGRECFQAYLKEEERRRQAVLDAMTPEEREAHRKFIEELRSQY